MCDAAVTVHLVDDEALAEDVAEVAATTFPLACPPGTTEADTADFIATTLTADHFRDHIAAAHTDLLVARAGDGPIIGYCLLHHGEPADAEVAAVITDSPVSEISKLYVVPDSHGGGVAHALMHRAIDLAGTRGAAVVWLGVSNVNLRAQRFYAKAGFRQVGRKSFWLNGAEQRDFVLARTLP